MLGFRKKQAKRNPIAEAIASSIKYSIGNEPTIPRPQKEVYQYFYDDGSINTRIPQEYLLSIPVSWRRYAYRLDWNKVFPPEQTSIEPESPDNPLSRVSRESEVYQDLFKLNQEKKDKIRAIVLGELKDG